MYNFYFLYQHKQTKEVKDFSFTSFFYQMYNWKMFVGNIMLDKVNKNNYINYISDKTEIKNKKINIIQGKILVKSF